MQPLTPGSILDAAEAVLRRFGPDKTSVTDIARHLGVSHGNIYRFYPAKAALREAVTRRWLDRGRDELAAICTDSTTTAPERLHRWLHTLFTTRRTQAADDPELFQTFYALATEHSVAVDEHVADLHHQLRLILTEGVAQQSFSLYDGTEVTARAVYNATVRFHHPAHARAWARRSDIDDDFHSVMALIMHSLTGTEHR